MSTEQASSPDEPAQQKRILVVEDDLVVQGTVKHLLVDQGYEVGTAADGSEALAQISRFKPDLVVLDLGLPLDPFSGGIADGFGVLQWLRRSPPEERPPVLVLTARQDAEARRQSFALGASVFLTKPFKAEDLFQAVRILLDEA